MITLRPYCEDDARIVCMLLRDFAVSQDPEGWEEYFRTSEDAVNGMFLKSGMEIHCTVAVVDDATPIAFCCTQRSVDILSKEYILRVDGLYVDPVFRRRGVAQMLLRDAEVKAVLVGATFIEWDTDEDNFAALMTYDNFGANRVEGVVYYWKKVPRNL